MGRAAPRRSASAPRSTAATRAQAARGSRPAPAAKSPAQIRLRCPDRPRRWPAHMRHPRHNRHAQAPAGLDEVVGRAPPDHDKGMKDQHRGEEVVEDRERMRVRRRAPARDQRQCQRETGRRIAPARNRALVGKEPRGERPEQRGRQRGQAPGDERRVAARRAQAESLSSTWPMAATKKAAPTSRMGARVRAIANAVAAKAPAARPRRICSETGPSTIAPDYALRRRSTITSPPQSPYRAYRISRRPPAAPFR